MSLLSKVWFVTGNASGLPRSIAEVRLLNLMAIVVTFSTPVIYSVAADTPLLLSRISDRRSQFAEKKKPTLKSSQRGATIPSGAPGRNTSPRIAGAEFCRQYIAGWAPPGNCRTVGSLEADALCDPGPPLRN